MLHTHDVTGSSPVVSTKSKMASHPGCHFFVPRCFSRMINCCLAHFCPPLWGGGPSEARSGEVRCLAAILSFFRKKEPQKPLPSALRAAFIPQRGRQGAAHTITSNNNLSPRVCKSERGICHVLCQYGSRNLSFPAQPLYRPCGNRWADGNRSCQEHGTLPVAAACGGTGLVTAFR